MFTEFTDIVPSFFGWLNQGPMTLTLFLQCNSSSNVFYIQTREEKIRE